MPKTKQQKIDIVADLKDRINKSKSIVFADYKGLTMNQMSELRSKLREADAEFTVTKNNLLKLALNDSRLTINDERLFEGPIATLFAYDDEITPIKLLTKALKDNQIGPVKGGIFEGEFMDEHQVIKLSNLPSKDELRAKIVGSLGSPLYGIVGVLQANLRNLVYALDQIRVQKGGE